MSLVRVSTSTKSSSWGYIQRHNSKTNSGIDVGIWYATGSVKIFRNEKMLTDLYFKRF